MQFDTAPIRAFLESRGIAADDIETFLDLLPLDSLAAESHAQHGHTEQGEDEEEGEVEGYRDRVLAQRGESGAERHDNGRGQQAARQRNLESSERRVAPEHSRENSEAYSRENRNSVQREGRDGASALRRDAISGGLRGSQMMAGDADLAAIDEIIERVPATGGRNPTRAELAAEEEAWRHRYPRAAMALDQRQREREDRAFAARFPGVKGVALDAKQRQSADAEFLADFPEAARVGIQP